MPVVEEITDQTGEEKSLGFDCPGCGMYHAVRIVRAPGDKSSPLWSWNGDFEKPTFEPSLLVRWDFFGSASKICHSFVRGGVVEFLSDCTHENAGKKLPLAQVEP